MNFDDLDARMRRYETAHDHCVLPGLFMVARLDGRSFTRLTKETHRFESPFDERVRDLMTGTVEHLMSCGFRVVYGYTQSDEISLLFHPDEELFDRKLRKYDSVLTGEASGKFSVGLGAPACFDCRVSQLPTRELVVDYFLWRAEDAHRNALNAHCYWLLRRDGLEAQAATHRLLGLSVSAKNEWLFGRGLNFNDLPTWQKRGVGVYWQDFEKAAFNPKLNQPVTALRRRLYVDLELPMREGYVAFLLTKLAGQSENLGKPQGTTPT